MPKGVEPPVMDAAALQKHRELILAGARVHGLADLSGHNIGIRRQLCRRFFQEKQQLRVQGHDPLRTVAFGPLHEKLRLAVQRDPLHGAADLNRSCQIINITNAQCADLAHAQSRVQRQHNSQTDFL